PYPALFRSAPGRGRDRVRRGRRRAPARGVVARQGHRAPRGPGGRPRAVGRGRRRPRRAGTAAGEQQVSTTGRTGYVSEQQDRRPTHDDRTTEEAQAGLNAILDDLAHLVETARTMPMSASVLVHKGDALALVDELRGALPEQLAHADEVLAQADAVLEDAHRQAEEILTTARARAIELVQAEQVVVQAESRAREIVDEAEEAAAALRRD